MQGYMSSTIAIFNLRRRTARGRYLIGIIGLLIVCAGLPATAHAAANDSDATITLNLKNADIREVAATIGEITDKNFIIDPRVQGKVTVLSSEPISASAVYKAFLSVLQVHGLAAVPTENGKFMKIVPALNARQLPGPMHNQNEPGDIIVTEVIPVKNVPAAQLVAVLRPLVSTESHLVAYPPSNMLIISDRAGNVARIKKIVHRVDKAPTSQFEVIPLENASASDVIDVLNQFVQQQGGQASKGVNPLKLAADQRTNSILVNGDKNDRMKIRALIAHLDTPTAHGGNTQVIYLQYAKAKDLANILKGYSQNKQKQNGGKGGHGSSSAPGNQRAVSVLPDKRTNSLVVTAPPKAMRQIHNIVARLDIRRAQVLVQGIIADLTSDRSAQLGITWAVDALNHGTAGVTNFSGTGTGITQVGGALTGAGLGGGIGTGLGGGIGTGLGGGSGTTGGGSGAVGGVASALNAIPDGLTLGVGSIVKAGISFAALLHALSADSTTNILSTPSVMTLDNQEADITVAKQVPFVTGQFTTNVSSGISNGVNPFQTIQREKVGIELKITPQINEGNSVLLKIDQKVSSLTGNSISNQPVTSDREVKTNVVANDGQVIVLGGLIQGNLMESEQRVPVLGDIPLLGNLFKYRKTDKAKRNLLIFLQPSILRSGTSTSYFTDQKYRALRDIELQNHSRVQLRPGLKRPTLPPLQQLQRRGVAPKSDIKPSAQGGYHDPASGKDSTNGHQH
jgi:general secretion pathway protein D